MARDATDLKRIIINEARTLFTTQGFQTTSIKDIARAANCTTAALYYYFEGGKSQILREVIRSYSLEISHLVAPEILATNLADFLIELGQQLLLILPQLLGQINWLLVEYSNLLEEDKAYLHEQFEVLHFQVAGQLKRFVPEQTEAEQLAWIVLCSYFGYGQIFISMQGQHFNPLSPTDFNLSLARLIGAKAS